MSADLKIDSGETVKIGDRVELQPSLDAWMFGDRYGEVVKIGTKLIHVLCDRSGRVRKLHPSRIGRVVR